MYTSKLIFKNTQRDKIRNKQFQLTIGKEVKFVNKVVNKIDISIHKSFLSKFDAI